MNIFALNSDPILAAQNHVDKHIVKMPLEASQILCTVVRGLGGEARYKPTHKNHPCTLWAGECSGNYEWLVQLGLALCNEYTHRYGREHACEEVIREVSIPRPALRIAPRGAFALAMPDQYKQDDAVESYRAYYRAEKAHLHSWKNRQPPEWL